MSSEWSLPPFSADCLFVMPNGLADHVGPILPLCGLLSRKERPARAGAGVRWWYVGVAPAVENCCFGVRSGTSFA